MGRVRVGRRARVTAVVAGAATAALASLVPPADSSFTVTTSPAAASFEAQTLAPVTRLVAQRQCTGAGRGVVTLSWDAVAAPESVTVTRDGVPVAGAGLSSVADAGPPPTAAATYTVVRTRSQWSSVARTVTVTGCSDRPLDLVSATAAVAYGLRQLDVGHIGPLVRVRRSGDGAQADIGLAGTEIDTTALLSFCGSGTCTVVTWYDQSGAGRHATQSDPVRQPSLVTTGALETARGRPALRYDGGQALYAPGVTLGAGVDRVTGNAVGALLDERDRLFGFTANGETADHDNSSSAVFFNRNPDDPRVRAWRSGGRGWLPAVEDGTYTYSQRFTGTHVELFRNGESGIPQPSAGPFGATGTVGLGANLDFGDAVGRLHGTLTEVTLFPTALPDVDLRALERSQLEWLAGGSPTPLQPPTGITADAGQGWIDVRWSPPDPTSAVWLIDHTATATPGGHECTAPASHAGCSLTGLDPATAYTITVAGRLLDGAALVSAPVTATPTGTEHLANRGFEHGSISGWSAEESAMTSDALSGAHAARTESTDELRQDAASLRPATAYTFSAWVRGADGETAELFARSPGITEITSGPISAGVWQRYTITFTTAPGATTATVGIRRTSPSGGQPDDFDIDDASLMTALPLEVVTAAPAAAYGLRLVDPDHAGPLVRVRRTSDDLETDIGAAGRELDTAALLSFCDATSCEVTTWYDQSGNDRHAGQTDTQRQPNIVSGGVLETARGRPTLRYTGNEALYAPGVILGTDRVTGNAIGSLTTLNDRLFGFTADGQVEDWNNSASAVFLNRRHGGVVQAFRGGPLGNLPVLEGTFSYSQRFTGTQIDLFRDGVAGTSQASAGSFGATGTIGLGASLNFSDPGRLDGTLSEVLLFGAALPDDQLRALESTQLAWLSP